VEKPNFKPKKALLAMSITDPMILNTSLLRAEILCGKGFEMSEVLSMFYKKLQNKKNVGFA
jgi:hypothetical protein